MEPRPSAEAGHNEEQELQRTDRIAKWVQQNEGNEPAASSATASNERGTEAGLISDLHDECLQSVRQLRLILEAASNSNVTGDEKTQLGNCNAKLNLWGDALEGGRLEACLRIVPALRSTILESLIRISKALLLACETHSALNKILHSDPCRERMSNLELLIEQAWDILHPQDSDLHELPISKPTDNLVPASVPLAKKSGDSSSGVGQKEWVSALLRTLTFRTRMLMELLPTIQQILTTAERGKRHMKGRVPQNFSVSEAARQWVRQVFDKFEDADEALAERLGQANSQRYEEIRRLKGQTDAHAQLAEEPDGTKTLFRPPTTIHDSGLGTSIITPADVPASNASHSSFASSVADDSSRRVPKTPEAVAQSKPFECEICGSLVSTIKNRAQWKAHVFADIKPYICTFGGCKDEFTAFPARRAWAEHEFHHHRCHITFACYDCPEQMATENLLLDHLHKVHSVADLTPQRSTDIILKARELKQRPMTEESCPLCRRSGWQLQRAFVKHLGRHMEDVALLALPTVDDPEKQEQSDQTDDEAGEPSAKSPDFEDAPVTETPHDLEESTKSQPVFPGFLNPRSPKSSKYGKRQKRDDTDSDSDDDDIQPIHFFVPGETINAAVLVEYINRYVDRTAKITSAQHPADKKRTGFNVLAKRALNAVSIRDLINDSRDWDLETMGREYRRNPYDYRESDTAKRRAKKGPSQGHTARPQEPPTARVATGDPAGGS